MASDGPKRLSEEPQRPQSGKPASGRRESSEAELPPRDPPEQASGGGGAGDGVDVRDVSRLGAHLARALQEGGYHPVILFGTSFSGKTSLLLSLISTLISEPRLETGLSLCDPILGSEAGIGRQLHEEARKLFEVKTQAFIEGENIPSTKITLPFFVPVEVRPLGRPPMRFAFLESNGEWYRPLREKNAPLANAERLFPELKREVEVFIASFQGGISFIYLTPYTQERLYSGHDNPANSAELQGASLAITGVLRAYDRVRITHRAADRHLMLVTKWDEHSARDADRAAGIQEDRDALNEFCKQRYSQAIATFQGLSLEPGQRQMNAYCSGIINERGLLQLLHNDDVRDVVMGYPIRLWNWLYKNALMAADQPVIPLFREPPKPPTLVRIWNRILDFMSGR